MRLLTFWDDEGELRLGVQSDYGVIDVEDALVDLFVDGEESDDEDFEDLISFGEYLADGPTLKATVERLLETLRPRDRFRIVAFSTACVYPFVPVDGPGAGI